jgi:hypothetical protein
MRSSSEWKLTHDQAPARPQRRRPRSRRACGRSAPSSSYHVEAQRPGTCASPGWLPRLAPGTAGPRRRCPASRPPSCSMRPDLSGARDDRRAQIAPRVPLLAEPLRFTPRRSRRSFSAMRQEVARPALLAGSGSMRQCRAGRRRRKLNAAAPRFVDRAAGRGDAIGRTGFRRRLAGPTWRQPFSENASAAHEASASRGVAVHIEAARPRGRRVGLRDLAIGWAMPYFPSSPSRSDRISPACLIPFDRTGRAVHVAAVIGPDSRGDSIAASRSTGRVCFPRPPEASSHRAGAGRPRLMLQRGSRAARFRRQRPAGDSFAVQPSAPAALCQRCSSHSSMRFCPARSASAEFAAPGCA